MLRPTCLRLLGAFLSVWLLSACSYHSRLPAHVYTLPAVTQKIPARVLLSSDDITQKTFVFKDYHLSSSVQSYKIDLAKGALISTADALFTLFDTVEVDKAKQAPAYDYLARLVYQVTDPRENSLESVQWLNYTQMPRLQTQVTLTLENPHTGEVILTTYAVRQNRVELNNVTAAAYHTQSTPSATLFLPVTAPVSLNKWANALNIHSPVIFGNVWKK